jgi:nicotinate-nucleotide adenylyltransferase
VWWLVAPQNPLKPVAGMAPFAERLASAKVFARHPGIRVFGLESELGTRFTADTIAALQTLYPRQCFVWLMGADNLAQIRHWQRWREIFARVPIAVFARPTYCRRGLAELAAKRFARARLILPARRLPCTKPPAWAFLPVKLDPSSATEIRSRQGRHSRGD